MGRTCVQGECPHHGHCWEYLGWHISKGLTTLQQEEFRTCYVS